MQATATEPSEDAQDGGCAQAATTEIVDLVYLLTKSNWNEEIRYSLRSFERFFPNLGTVWIVGYLPPYLNRNTVRHIPDPPMPRPGVFVESIAKRILNDELSGLSERYVMAQDDNYVLRDVTIADFGPLWIEDMDQVKSRGTSPWQQMLWRTHDILKFLGHTSHNYEAHSPVIVNRRQYQEVAAKFVHLEQSAHERYDSICTISAYWNILGTGSYPRRWASDVRFGFTSPADAENSQAIQARLEGRTFFFHNDEGLTEALKGTIKTLYPDKSRFEF